MKHYVLIAAAMVLTSGAALAHDDCDVREYAMGVRFQQQSAEVRALQMQAYNLARVKLDEALAKPHDRPVAIVTDIDETLVDNTPLLAQDISNCHEFTKWDTWTQWELTGKPGLIPGAKAFLDYADSKGVKIFYISDRYEERKSNSLDTLHRLELPQVSEESVMLLGPPKAERRAKVAADYDIVMLLGDTLHDFDAGFATKDLGAQRALVTENADRFGTEWIVFPNAAYGKWSKAPLEGPKEAE